VRSQKTNLYFPVEKKVFPNVKGGDTSLNVQKKEKRPGRGHLGTSS